VGGDVWFFRLIFNHGNWFAPGGGDAASHPIEWTVDVTALPQWPEPDALARKVVAALNAAEKDKAGVAEYRLSAEGAPKLQGGVSLQGQDEAGGSVSLSFDRQERKGTTLHSPPGPSEEQVKLETNDAELLNATKDALLAAAGKADQKLSATKWMGDGDFPRLSFPWKHGKERRVANYDLRSGLVSLSPEARSMRMPDFLTSLHMSHGYPRRRSPDDDDRARCVCRRDGVPDVLLGFVGHCHVAAAQAAAAFGVDGGHRVAAHHRVCLERDVPDLYGEVRESRPGRALHR
jgi:hypothetical protein